MKALMLLTVAGLAGGMAPGTIAAQAAASARLASMESAPLATPAYDERDLRRRMDSAERAMERGSELTARKMYEAIAKELVEAGMLPTEPMWKLATLRYKDGDALAAAAILDELATAASTHGDVVVEVRALFEAARIYQLEGKVTESVFRMDRAFRVLSGSALPSDTQVALLRAVRG